MQKEITFATLDTGDVFLAGNPAHPGIQGEFLKITPIKQNGKIVNARCLATGEFVTLTDEQSINSVFINLETGRMYVQLECALIDGPL